MLNFNGRIGLDDLWEILLEGVVLRKGGQVCVVQFLAVCEEGGEGQVEVGKVVLVVMVSAQKCVARTGVWGQKPETE